MLQTVDEQQNFTEEEFLRYEEELRRNMDPNMAQPRVVVSLGFLI